MATWRILGETGNDANAGNVAAPWRTLGMIASKIDDSTIQAGDIIEIGETFRSQYINVTGIPVTIRQAPGQPLARMTYANPITTAWANVTGSIYQTTLPTGVQLVVDSAITYDYDNTVIFDHHAGFLKRRTADANLVERNTYHYDTATRVLTVWVATFVPTNPLTIAGWATGTYTDVDLTVSANAEKIEYIEQTTAAITFANGASASVLDLRGGEASTEIYGEKRIVVDRCITFETGVERRYTIRVQLSDDVRILGGRLENVTSAHMIGGVNRALRTRVIGTKIRGRNHLIDEDGFNRNYFVFAGQGIVDGGNVQDNQVRGIDCSIAPLMRADGTQSNPNTYTPLFARTHAGDSGPAAGALQFHNCDIYPHPLWDVAPQMVNSEGPIKDAASPMAPAHDAGIESFALQYWNCRIGPCSMGGGFGSAAFKRCFIDTRGTGFASGISIATTSPGILFDTCTFRVIATVNGERPYTAWAGTSGWSHFYRLRNCLHIWKRPAALTSGTAAERAGLGILFRNAPSSTNPDIIFTLEHRFNIVCIDAPNVPQNHSTFVLQGGAWADAGEAYFNTLIGNTLWWCPGVGNLRALGDRFMGATSGSWISAAEAFNAGQLFEHDYRFVSDVDDFTVDLTNLGFESDSVAADIFDPAVPLHTIKPGASSPIPTITTEKSLTLQPWQENNYGIDGRRFNTAQLGPYGLGDYLVSASVAADGVTVTLVFWSDEVTCNNAMGWSVFDAESNEYSPNEDGSPVVDGNTLTYTLSTPVPAGAALTINYDQLIGFTFVVHGFAVDSFEDFDVTNNAEEPPAGGGGGFSKFFGLGLGI